MGRFSGALAELKASEMDIRESAELMQRTLQAMVGASSIPIKRINVPGGSSAPFFSMGDDDADHAVKEIVGVILGRKYTNAYWDKPSSEGKTAPICASQNGVSGWYYDGDELIEQKCATCPRNRMGSAGNGRKGKACKNSAKLLMLVEGQTLPIEVNVPTMSLDNYNYYFANTVAARGLDIYQVTTKLSLSKTKNAKGDAYYQIVFKCEGRVDDNDIRSLMGLVRPMLLGEGAQTDESRA